MSDVSLCAAIRDAHPGATTTISDGERVVPVPAVLDDAMRFAEYLAKQPEGTLVVVHTKSTMARAVVSLAADAAGLPAMHVDPRVSDPRVSAHQPGLVIGDHVPPGVKGESTAAGPGLWSWVQGEPQQLTAIPARSQIFLTSGSTGRPVAVVRSAQQIITDCQRIAGFLGYASGTAVAAATGVYHAYGFAFGLIGPMLAGASARYCSPMSTPSQLVRAIRGEQARTFLGTAYQLKMLAAVDVTAIPSLRQIISSGTAPDLESGKALDRRGGLTVYNAYGSSETGAISLARIHQGSAPGDAGPLLPGIEAALDPAVQVGDGQELLLRTASLAAGYLAADGVTLDPLAVADGWYRTGDLAKLSGNNTGREITLCGRLSNVINVGGRKLTPSEVEPVLCAHPRVAEAQVLGEPDTIRGQVPVARVVPSGELDLDELLAWCRERLAPHQVPRRFDVLTELPRSSMGKLLKNIPPARSLGAEGKHGDEGPPDPAPVLARLRQDRHLPDGSRGNARPGTRAEQSGVRCRGHSRIHRRSRDSQGAGAGLGRAVAGSPSCICSYSSERLGPGEPESPGQGDGGAGRGSG